MHRLLFIHTDPKLQSVYKRHLTNYFNVDSAYDGLEGLRLIKSSSPDIVLSEYSLPKLSANSLLKFVREHEYMNTIPFIFLSYTPAFFDSLEMAANEWLTMSTITPDKLVETCFKHLKLNQPIFIK
jgi:DNA-binding response OmpR family regulator